MAANTRLFENIKFVALDVPKSYSSITNVQTMYLSLKNYNHCTYWIHTGAWAAGTAAVTLAQATAVAGTGTKALAFSKVWINTAALNDTWTETAVTSNTFTLGTVGLGYLIEIDAATLDVSGGFDCVALLIASPGANADFYETAAFLSGSRYKQGALPSAIID